MLLGAALVFFELFNFQTSRDALEEFFGPAIMPLAIGCCLVDIAGLIGKPPLRSLRNKIEASTVETSIFFVWIIASVSNALLTAVWANSKMMQINPNHPEILYIILPAIVALIVWAIRYFIIVNLSQNGFRIREESHNSVFAQQ